MALAGRVLDQNNLAGADLAGFAVARRQFNAGVEIDDVLPPRRRMPWPIVFRLGLTKNDAVGCLQLNSLTSIQKNIVYYTLFLSSINPIKANRKPKTAN